MQPKRVLVLDGHPAPTSLSRGFAEAYAETATACGHEVRLRHLSDMTFDPDHETGGYATTKPLEPVLQEVLDDLDWCAHFVICAPMWWGSFPAKLKGLIDRSFIPGRTFSTRETTFLGLPKPLLTGRSARVVITSDSPGYYLRLAHGNAMKRQVKGQILGFVGFRPVRFSYFAPASDPGAAQVEAWMKAVRSCAAKAR